MLMIRFWAALSGLVMVSSFGFGGVAHARTISVSDDLYVEARVLERQTIIVDDDNQIITVMSNTTEDVTPRIYRNHAVAQNEIELTDEHMEQYRQIVPLGTSVVGIRHIYKPIFTQPSVMTEQPAAADTKIVSLLTSLL